jgi:hypothetical protein
MGIGKFFKANWALTWTAKASTIREQLETKNLTEMKCRAGLRGRFHRFHPDGISSSGFLKRGIRIL